MNQKRNYKCFVITPIGNETDSIRRHIDGIIEAAIRPSLREYEVLVAHKITEPGTITKQVLKEIYEDDLVIANLTNNNPNVMYELAFRHCLGKPTIMIAEKGTSLPSDIIMERTIFYCNDAQGVIDLREELEKAEANIDFSQSSSPIHDILKEFYITNKIIENVQKNETDEQLSSDALQFIISKLNSLEERLYAQNTYQRSVPKTYIRQFVFEHPAAGSSIDSALILTELQKVSQFIKGSEVNGIAIDSAGRTITVNASMSKPSAAQKMTEFFVEILDGFTSGTINTCHV